MSPRAEWKRDPAGEPDTAPIQSLEDFRDRVSLGFGVIVIDDKARTGGPTYHDPGCPFVTEDFFREKILEMDARNGTYTWAKNGTIAENELWARPCGHQADRVHK